MYEKPGNVDQLARILSAGKPRWRVITRHVHQPADHGSESDRTFDREVGARELYLRRKAVYPEFTHRLEAVFVVEEAEPERERPERPGDRSGK